MNVSLFQKLVVKFFSGFVKTFYEFTNDSKKQLTYLHERMFRLDYSPTMQWGSSRFNNSIVAADIVALDSSLPLKRRPSMGKASGDIPKLGMKVAMRESDYQELKKLEAVASTGRGLTEAQLAGRLLVDAGKVIPAIKEQVERMSLEALSKGYTMVAGAEGDSKTGVRVEYGYLAENKFGSAVKWGEQGFKPISDMQRVISRASDNGSPALTHVMMSLRSFNLMRNSEEARLLGNTIVVKDPKHIPTPNRQEMIDRVASELGVTIIVVDRTIRIEQNGQYSTIRPWEESSVVFLPSEDVGRLVYTETAEETSNVPGVIYEKPNPYTLVFKYSKTDPLREFTASQAQIIPVIDGVNDIYLLDNSKQGEISADETSLTFEATDDLKSNPQVVTILTEADMISVKSNDRFIRATTSGKEVHVTVSANNADNAPQRQGTITVTDIDGRNLTIIVTQAGNSNVLQQLGASIDLSQNVGAIASQVNLLESVEELNKLRTLEASGGNRVGVVNAIDARIIALTSPPE